MSPKKSGMSHDLIIPSQSGNVEVVRLLCVLGTDVNTPGENGATPAFFASQSRGERPAGRAQLLAKWQHTDRLQNPAKLRRFWIGGGIWAG